MKSIAKLAGIALVGTMMAAATAQAIPVSGTINFGGINSLTGGSSFATATGVDFIMGWTAGGTGDFAAIPILTATTFQDFTFSPVMAPNPVVPLWTLSFGGLTYDFDMTSVTVLVHDANTLSLAGKGILGITGFDDTPGDWNFTTQPSGASPVLSFSASSVPEPGTMALLGVGLLGLAGAARKRKIG